MGNISRLTNANAAIRANKGIKTNDKIVTNDKGNLSKVDLEAAYEKATIPNAKNTSIFIQSKTGSDEFLKLDLANPENKSKVESMINDLKTGQSVSLDGVDFKMSNEKPSKINYSANGKVLDQKLASNPHYSKLKNSGGKLSGQELTSASKSDFQGFKTFLDGKKMNSTEGIQQTFKESFDVELNDADAKFFYNATNNGVSNSSEVNKLQTILTKLDPSFDKALAEHGSVDSAYGYATTKAVNMLSFNFNKSSFNVQASSSEATNDLLNKYDLRAIGVDVSGSMKADIQGVSNHEAKLKENKTELYSYNNYQQDSKSHGVIGSGKPMQDVLEGAAETKTGSDHESPLKAGIDILDDLASEAGPDGKVKSKNGKQPAIALYTDEKDYDPALYDDLLKKANKLGVKVLVVAIKNDGEKAVIDLTSPKVSNVLKNDIESVKSYVKHDKRNELDWWSKKLQ